MSHKHPPLKPGRRATAATLLCMSLVATAGTVRFLQGSASESFVISVSVVSGDAVPVDVVAIPEKRVPSTGNNGTLLSIEVRPEGSTDVLYSGVINTSSGGTYSDLQLTGINEGTYDVSAKGFSHLRRTLASLSVSSGMTLDFTDDGDDPLLSGDVNSTDGDNKVNGIDLTLIVNDLNGGQARYDLNRDTRVNGIDLTNAVTNLNVTGDS